MAEVEYMLARFDERLSRWKGSRIVLHGSREYARAIIERFDAGYGFEAVVSAELPAGSEFCGKPVVANGELASLRPDVIIMTERVRHAEAVYLEIGALCAQAGIALYDMYGLDWLDVRREIDGQQPQTLAGWLSIAEGYDVVTFEAPGPLLQEDGDTLVMRPSSLQLVKLLQERGKTVLFIGRAPYTAEQQKAALAASGIIPEGSSIDDLFFMRAGEDGSWHAICSRYPGARILNIGHGIPKECILPRYYGASSYRMLYGIVDNVELSGSVRRIAKLAARGKSLGRAAKQAIDDADIVSFDVFDTLLVRKALDPSDVFAVVEQRAHASGIDIEGFAALRAEAQATAGNLGFEQIYKAVQSKLDLSDDELAALQRIEFATERELIAARAPVCDLMRYAASRGKRVFLVSDMYYSSEQLGEILGPCGLPGYDALVISCEHGALKRQGLLAKLLELGAGAEKVLHIGNSIEDDVKPALELGMRALLVPSVRDLALSNGYRARMQAAVALEQRLALGAEIADVFANPFHVEQEAGARGRVELPAELRRALLSWYPFPPGERALLLGLDSGPHLSVMTGHYAHVDTVLDEEASYDCIALLDPLLEAGALADLLEQLRSTLAPNGVLLIGFRNRFGLKYLCGGIDEAVALPFSTLEPAPADRHVLHGRREMAAILERAGLPEGRTYCVMPDPDFAQAVYAEDFIPAEGIHDRIMPFDAHGSPLIASERDLYDSVAREGMLAHHANYYVRECRKPGSTAPAASVVYAVLSADRGREHSFATLLLDDGTAVKRPLYPEGLRALAGLADNADELASRGISVVPQELKDGALHMPVAEGRPLLAHLAELLPDRPDDFTALFDQLYATILSSSDIVPATAETCRAWGADAEDLGPVLATGFIDMIPYNAFWRDGEMTFLDQEFALADCPAKYILFRALRYTWVHLPQAQRAIPLELLKERFGLAQLWDRFAQREDEFVAQNRNRDAHRQIYDWACVDRDAIASRRRSLIASRGDGGPLPSPGDKPYGVGLLMGVFDLFHIGHLRLIKRAKQRCGFLRVGVLDDALVEQAKGISPTIPLEQRMEIVAAISEVDEVVAIAGSTSRLVEWENRPFDCFFSGDDYSDDENWERERRELRQLGAEIEFFPYTEEQSSSSIRKRLGRNPS